MTDQWYLEVVKGVPRVCRESEMALKRSRGRRGQQEREREREREYLQSGKYGDVAKIEQYDYLKKWLAMQTRVRNMGSVFRQKNYK
jgi:hypothetical protein